MTNAHCWKLLTVVGTLMGAVLPAALNSQAILYDLTHNSRFGLMTQIHPILVCAGICVTLSVCVHSLVLWLTNLSSYKNFMFVVPRPFYLYSK